VLPAAVILLVLSVYPLVQLIRMSASAVTSANLHDAWSLVGAANFTADFHDGVFWSALQNTVVFVVIITVLSLAAGFAAAVALRSSGRLTAFLMGLMVFIWALPPVVNGSVWKFLLADDGLFNGLLRYAGLHHPLPFLYDPHWALYSVAIVNAWAVIPFNALVFRAALIGIPEEILEAARIDGANRWQLFRRVTLPLLRPTLALVLVFSVAGSLLAFDQFYIMTNGGPRNETITAVYQIYRVSFVQFQLGYGAALSVLLMIVLAAVSAVQLMLLRNTDHN